MIRACARSLAILVCVDGLASYVTAVLRVFRPPVWTGRRGRPRLVLEPGLSLGQVVKRDVQRRVVRVKPRVVRGTAEPIAAVLAVTHSGTAIQTAYIERLNATFRSALAAGMWLVGCGDNFCGLHQSLRLTAPLGAPWK